MPHLLTLKPLTRSVLLLASLMLHGVAVSEQGLHADAEPVADIEILVNTRHALGQMKYYMYDHPELFVLQKISRRGLTSREQRNEIWGFWQGFLDRMLMLDNLGSKYEALYKEAEDVQKKHMFRLSYAAFLMQYRYAIELIRILENDPAMHTTLNEPVPELGLDQGSYRKLKFRFLNVARAAEFIRLNTVYIAYGADNSLILTPNMTSDIKTLMKMGLGDGTVLTFRNALKMIDDAGFTVWYPAQKNVSEWMGDIKVLRTQYSLIKPEQISEMEQLLQPGDILLERREWYLSNIGLPGYWPHAALYVGTTQQRAVYFNDEATKQRYATAGGFEALLEQKYPESYAISVAPDKSGHLPRVIEAISEGVSFTTLEHSVDADSVAILRPRLSKLEKAIAIERAFHFSGRPYDFNFDFLTDAELVCTELVYKVYEPASGYTGLTFPTRKIMGRTVTTANDIARMFDIEFVSDKLQLNLIAFYDGHERRGTAVRSDVNAFRHSWKRPKAYIWVQDTLLEPYFDEKDRDDLNENRHKPGGGWLNDKNSHDR